MIWILDHFSEWMGEIGGMAGLGALIAAIVSAKSARSAKKATDRTEAAVSPFQGQEVIEALTRLERRLDDQNKMLLALAESKTSAHQDIRRRLAALEERG